MTMNCDDMAAGLTDLLEGDLDAATEAAALDHLATCPNCEQVLRRTEDLRARSRHHGTEALDASDRDRLLDGVLDRISEQRRSV